MLRIETEQRNLPTIPARTRLPQNPAREERPSSSRSGIPSPPKPKATSQVARRIRQGLPRAKPIPGQTSQLPQSPSRLTPAANLRVRTANNPINQNSVMERSRGRQCGRVRLQLIVKRLPVRNRREAPSPNPLPVRDMRLSPKAPRPGRNRRGGPKPGVLRDPDKLLLPARRPEGMSVSGMRNGSLLYAAVRPWN